jgi:hypothetical protein
LTENVLDAVRHLLKNSPVEIDHLEATKTWKTFRVANGVAPHAKMLTAPDENAKMNRSGKPDYSLSLAPADTSGPMVINGKEEIVNVCRYFTETCKNGCIAHQGRARMVKKGFVNRIARGRALKVKFLIEDPSAFCTLVKKEVLAAVKKHGEIGVRLNAFSDITWETVCPWLLETPNETLYDYSKWPNRTVPSNYHLLFSASDRTSDAEIVRRVKSGENVAVVFNAKYRTNGHWQIPLPTEFHGVPVIDGDKVDTRYEDPKGVVVGLRIKGNAMALQPGKMVRPL